MTTEFRGQGTLGPIPDNQTIAQFFLDNTSHPLRRERPANVPLFIDDSTGQTFSFAEARRPSWLALVSFSLTEWRV